MSEELSTVSKISSVAQVSSAPAAPSDYDIICAALMQTERGRWFLQEYTRRNRSADTKLLLAAIQRIEAVVCAERDKQAQQARAHEFRSDLLEMANAITRTRAEVAEIRQDAPRPSGKPRDIFAAAERIRDVTWAMRGHGFDPSTCDQLEALAASILSASALRDPTDHRVNKLSEVLQYLEQRIGTLLQGGIDQATTADDPESDIAAAAEPMNGFALVAAEDAGTYRGAEEADATDDPPRIALREEAIEAPAAEPPAAEPPAEPPMVAGDPRAATPSFDIAIAAQEPFPAEPVAAAVEGEIEPAIVPPLPEPETVIEAEIEAAAELETKTEAVTEFAIPPENELAIAPTPAIEADEPAPQAAPPHGKDADLIDTGAIAVRVSADATLLGELDLHPASQAEDHPVVEVAAAALEAAPTQLPDIETDFSRPNAEEVPPAPPRLAIPPALPAAETMALRGDPLAALNAMSEEELIALFS